MHAVTLGPVRKPNPLFLCRQALPVRQVSYCQCRIANLLPSDDDLQGTFAKIYREPCLVLNSGTFHASLLRTGSHMHNKPNAQYISCKLAGNWR